MSSPSDLGQNLIQNLTNAARGNPLSTALISMGVLWLFTGARGAGAVLGPARGPWEDVTTTAADAAGAVHGAAGRLADSVAGAAAPLREEGARLMSEVGDRLEAMPGAAGGLLDDMRSNVASLFQSQPLVLGAVGLAIGAAVAASLPATETEGAYFGEASRSVKDRAGQIIVEQTDRAAEIKTRVIDAVVDEARQQRLTASDLKDAAGDVAGKMGRVADAAMPKRF